MSTSAFPGWISLDSLDDFVYSAENYISRHSGPWARAPVHDYEEQFALHSYSTVAPDHAAESSVADFLPSVLFYACVVVMVWAFLMPIYLAFKPQILAALKPFDDFTRRMCEELDYALPKPVLAYEVPELDTSRTEDVDDALVDSSEEQLPPPSPLPPAGTPTIPMDMGFVRNILSHLRTLSKQDRDEVLKQQKTQLDSFWEEMSKWVKPAPTTPASPPATAADVHGILEECRQSTLADCQTAIQEQQTAFKVEMAKLIQDATAAPTPPPLTTLDLDALAKRIQEQTIESCTTVFQGSLAGTKKDLLDEVKLANREAHEECNTKAARLPVSESREFRRMKEQNSLLRKDIAAMTAEQDNVASRIRVVAEKQRTNSVRQIELARRIIAGQHQDHVNATKRHVEVAMAAQIDHVQDLAAKDALVQQLDAKHKQTIKNATTLYQKTKRALDDTVAEHATASEQWKAEYRDACAKAAEEKAKEVAKGVEERRAKAASDHAAELQAVRTQSAATIQALRTQLATVQVQHAAEQQRADGLQDHRDRLVRYCDRLRQMTTNH